MGKNKLKLFDDEDDGCAPEEGAISINKAYAERYDNWRRLEELQKMKDKYGPNFEMEETSSSSESETEWSIVDEKKFLLVLSALKGKDESIKDGNHIFYKLEAERSQAPEMKKEKKERKKKMTLKDYERELVLRGGDIDEEKDGEEPPNDEGYYEEQARLKKELLEAMGDADDEEEEGDLLVRREKTKQEEKREEDAYYAWLAGKEGAPAPKEAKELAALRKAWTDPNIDENEKFLRDYFVFRKWDTDTEDRRPTYEQICELEQDEEEDEKARIYERKYNFRFEEPDKDFIKQYPRTVAESLRQKETKRAEKRERYRERKKREKEEKMKEISQMKKMKKTEIEKKLEKLRELTGEDIKIDLDDLEKDFDPKEYDRRMQEVFDAEYYSKEVEHEDEDEPPPAVKISDDEDAPEEFDAMKAGSEQEEYSDEEDGGNEETIEKQKKAEGSSIEKHAAREKASRNRKKRNSAFVAAVRKPKPRFDPNVQTFEEYFEQYFALDYEDIIGDQPTKFKYRTVVPNNFGLTTEEVLKSDDRQLNAWASLKKAVSYRSEKEEEYDVNSYAMKAKNAEKKRRILTADFGGKKSKKQAKEDLILNERLALEEKRDAEEELEVPEKKKKKRKNKRVPEDENGGKTLGEITEAVAANEPEEGSKRKRNRKRKKHVDAQEEGNESVPQGNTVEVGQSGRDEEDERQQNDKRKKHRDATEYQAEASENVESKEESSKKMRNRKRKRHLDGAENGDNKAAELNTVEGGRLDGSDENNKRKKHEYTAEGVNGGDLLTDSKAVTITSEPKGSQKKNRNHKKGRYLDTIIVGVSDKRLKAFGINPKKFKGKLAFGKKPTRENGV